MNCKGVIRELSSYLDGELNAAMRQELESHLADCIDCKVIVTQTKTTVEIFWDCEMVEFPADVRERLHEAVRRAMRAESD